jgi:hypothetical protein
MPSTNAEDAVQPTKWREALRPNKPLRNSRLETHRNDEGAALAPPLWIVTPPHQNVYFKANWMIRGS